MPLVDERGRLFGKVNLIDAGAVFLVLILVPLGYGAYALFRAPLPTITALRPTTMVAGKDLRVEVEGTNLRPFMRATIGPLGAKAFLIQSPLHAEVKLPELAPGTYDFALYDESQELVRRVGALTVTAPAIPPVPPAPSFLVQARGLFTGLTASEARALKVGLTFSADGGTPLALVLALQPPEPAVQRIRMGPDTVIANPIPAKLQVPAILDVRCAPAPDGCHVGGAIADRNATLLLPQRGTTTGFQVEEVRPAGSPVIFPPPPLPPLPDAIVRLFGTFTALDEAQARALRVGTRFPASGSMFAEVLSLQRAEPASQPVRVGPGTVVTPLAGRTQFNGVIRVRCTPVNEGCKVGDTVLARNATLSLPGGRGYFRFLIREVGPTTDPIPGQVRVRFVTRPEVRNLIKVGDVDVSSLADGHESSASLIALGATQTLDTQVNITIDPEPDPNRRQSYHSVPQQLVEFEATMSVPLDEGRLGWQYQGELIKVGSPFSFDTPLYTIRGWVLQVTPSDRVKK